MSDDPIDATGGRRVRWFSRRSDEPRGQTSSFVHAVRCERGDAFVASWLTSRTCQFEERTIWTHETGRERIMAECSGLLELHGVRVEVDGASRAHFRSQSEGLSFSLKRRRRKRA